MGRFILPDLFGKRRTKRRSRKTRTNRRNKTSRRNKTTRRKLKGG